MYVARTADEYNKFIADSEGKTDEEQSQIRQAYHDEHYGFLCSFFAIKEDLDIETVIETHMGMTAEEAPYTEVGQANGLKYYYVQDPIDESLQETFPEEMYEEYVSLATDGEKYITDYTFSEPVALVEATEEGAKISFEATDLDGNAVKSEDVFKDCKVTMINIWATHCDPCKKELPELEELNKKYVEMGCQIIGICDDTLGDEKAVEKAKAILEENGVTYLNLIQTEELSALIPAISYPTTYFVDSEGTLLTEPVRGANFASYDEKMQEALAAIGE